MNGLIIVDKEINKTSRDVVNGLCRILNTKRIGHTGTLDPIATGVLVCLCGKYTKLVEKLTSEEKEYVGTIKLGVKTDTLDITGNVLEKEKVKKLEITNIQKVLASFKGSYEQTVPLYSAVHVNGKRLYEYARNKEDVVLPKKKVMIKDIELLNYQDDEIVFRTLVSKGTYIRSLIQDICQKLEVIGTMQSLQRTKQGIFKIEDASKIIDIENNNYHLWKIEEIFDVQVLDIKDYDEKKIQNGNILNLNLDGYVLFKECGEEKALYYFENNLGKLQIMF